MDIPGIIEYINLNSEVGNIVYVPYYMPQTNPKFQDSDETFKEKVMPLIEKFLTENDELLKAFHKEFDNNKKVFIKKKNPLTGKF